MAMAFLSVAAMAQNANKHLANYLILKEALVNGDSKAASNAASMLHASLTEDGAFAQKNELLRAADAIMKPSGIEPQRATFGELSATMWTMLQGTTVTHPVYYHYCPKKKAHWVSNEKTIRNPYYGKSMLTCGKVAEMKK